MMQVEARSKSLFLLPAVALSILLCLLSVVQALGGGADRLAWWGAAIAALPLPVTTARQWLTPAPRAPENAPLALLVAAIGTFIALWEFLLEGVADWVPSAAAAAATVLLLLYVYWYSRFGRIASGALDVGSKLPQFAATDLDGNPVDSRELLGKPAVLLFYRGNWCSFCMGQVSEMAARAGEFDELGIDVALISPQSPERSRELAERLDVPFRFWVDRDNRAATELDIAIGHGVPAGWPGGYASDTVMPTLVVTNTSGTIVFSDQTDNDRVRPEPDLFLAVLRRVGAIAR